MTESTEKNTATESREPWQQELTATLQGVQDLLTTYANGKRKETNWQTAKWMFMGTVAIVSFLAWAAFNAKMIGFQTDPVARSIAKIQIQGEIGPTAKASADRIVPLIERACEAKHVTAVLLDINSGGGSPSEAERIIASMKACRQPKDGGKPKPIYSLINGAGASAAYMIPMNTDRVFAGKYSIVGSIGAIIRYPDASELAHRFGIHEKIYRSAPLKGGPSMISGSTPEDDEAYQEMVVKMGKTFLAEVKARRKGKITIPDDLLFSGRVWTAEEALKYGLVDEIAVLEDLKAGLFKGAKIYEYKQKSSFAEGMGFSAAIREAMFSLTQPQVQ